MYAIDRLDNMLDETMRAHLVLDGGAGHAARSSAQHVGATFSLKPL